MRRIRRLIVAAALALLPPIWGGASSASPAPAGLPRTGPPPSVGTIAIEPRTADGDFDPAMHTFVDAASQALTARGFTVLEDPAHAAYAVELVLSRAGVGTGLGKDPNGVSAFGAGTGVVVPLSTGNSNIVTLRRTKLEMRIRKRGETGLVWDGAAVTVRTAGTRKGTDEAVASDLSAALLSNYPIEPRDVIGVP